MKFLPQFKLNRKGKIWTTVVLLIIVIYIINPMFSLKNYNVLLDADTLNIYSNHKLITTVNNPGYMIDTYKDIVGVYVTNNLFLGISRIRMSELCRLEFIKDGKIISSIKILTPKNQKAIDKIVQSGSNGYWMELDNHYVIMTENYEYFAFGADFFQNLSEILKGDVK